MLLRYEPLNKQTHNKTFINITNFSEILQVCHTFFWRRVRDSNPRTPYEVFGFQDRRNRPLCQPSNNLLYRWDLNPRGVISPEPNISVQLLQELPVYSLAAREGLEPTTRGLDLVGGIEPPSSTNRGILPLNYTRLVCFGKPLLIQSAALTN